MLVVYRNSKPKVDTDTNRRYGETGASERVQLNADRKWWPIAPARIPRIKGFVFVVDGKVTRIRAVKPGGKWDHDDRNFYDAPLTAPLTEIEIARQFPHLGLALGDNRPHKRGKIREYLPVDSRPGALRRLRPDLPHRR